MLLLILFDITARAILTIGLGGAEAPGPEQGGEHKLVSQIPSYRVILLKLMMEWKLLEPRVDRAHGAQKKKTASSSPQILG